MSFLRIFSAIAVIALGCTFVSIRANGEVFVPQRGPEQTDMSWQMLQERLEQYPCPVLMPPKNTLVVRESGIPLQLFLCSGWAGEEGDASLFYGQADHLDVFRLISQKDEQVHLSLALWRDAVTQMNRTIDYSYSHVSSSTFLNTWAGSGPCYPIERAQFVAHLIKDPTCDPTSLNRPNSVFCGIYNAGVLLYSGSVRGFKDFGFPPDSFLVDLANKFSSLFRDTTEVTLLRPPEGELTLTVVEKASDSMTVEWEVAGSLADHWVRVDCVQGELAIDTPDDQPGDSRRVILTNAPHKGTTITLYAISPDGTTWYAMSLPPGDPNGDGRINILDMIYLRNRMGLDPSNPDNANADVNADGKINVLDFMMVREWIAEKDVRLYP